MSGGIPRTGHLEFPSAATLAGSPALLIAATSSPGTTWHAAASGADDVDLVWAWAVCQNAASARTLYLEVGGAFWAPFTIPRLSTPTPILQGIPFDNARAIAFYASVASEVLVFGRIYRLEKGAVA